MRYSVEINPEKEREFLEIMEALQRLEVVYELKHHPRPHLDRKVEHSISWQEGWGEEKTSSELADQYRDLVD